MQPGCGFHWKTRLFALARVLQSVLTEKTILPANHQPEGSQQVVLVTHLSPPLVIAPDQT
jgi:hypothetical protein